MRIGQLKSGVRTFRIKNNDDTKSLCMTDIETDFSRAGFANVRATRKDKTVCIQYDSRKNFTVFIEMQIIAESESHTQLREVVGFCRNNNTREISIAHDSKMPLTYETVARGLNALFGATFSRVNGCMVAATDGKDIFTSILVKPFKKVFQADNVLVAKYCKVQSC